MQLDPPPNTQCLWNWQENVSQGLNILYNKRIDEDVDRSAESAIRWLKRQLAHAMYYNNGVDTVQEMPNVTYYGINLDEPYWQCNLNNEELSNIILQQDVVGHLHIVNENNDNEPLPAELSGDEYNTLDDTLRAHITISDNASIITQNADGTYDRLLDSDDDTTLFDALAVRLYNGGLFLAYVYDGNRATPYGYWEVRPGLMIM